jgi:hypothetical protein
MANPYFRNIPDFEYVSRAPEPQNISDYTAVKNLFKRGKLREEIFGNLNFFTKYNIIGDERPDNVASKIYGDETLDWVILLSNNILNIRTEWPMPQRAFDRFLLGKYRIGNEDEEETYNRIYNGIHHYESPEIRNSQGITILKKGLTIPQNFSVSYYDSLLGINETVGSKDEEFIVTNIFSGNGTTSSNIITVELNRPIGGLNVNSAIQIQGEIKIQGVPTPGYNGSYEIDEVVNPTTIRYKTVTAPKIPNPNISASTVTLNVTKSNIAIPITNFEFEDQIQNKKRNIFILKPIYLNVVYNDLDSIMPYKQGSTQYLSRTLKRGDNIRLYQ